MHATVSTPVALRLALSTTAALVLGWSWSAAAMDASSESAGASRVDPLVGITQECLVGNNFEDQSIAGWTGTNTSIFEVRVGGPEGSNFYIHAKDGNGASTVDSPSPYVGNWIVLTGGCGNFCYDVNLFDDGEAGSAAIPANFYLYSGGTIAQFVAFDISEPGGANPGWHRVCAPVRSADGNVLPSNGAGQWRINGETSGQQVANAWNILIRNVMDARFPVDWASSNQNEEVGYDNFCLFGEGCGDPTPTPTPQGSTVTGVIRTERGCSEAGPAVDYSAGETVPISYSIAGADSAAVRVTFLWPDGGQETPIDEGTILSGQQYSVDPPLVIEPDALPGGRRVVLEERVTGNSYREIARCSFSVVRTATDTPTPVEPTATPTRAPCVAPGCVQPSSVMPVHNLPQEPNQNPPVSCAVASCHDGIRIVPQPCPDCPAPAGSAVAPHADPGAQAPAAPTRRPYRLPTRGVPIRYVGPVPTVRAKIPGLPGGSSYLSAPTGNDWRHIPRTGFDGSAMAWGSGAAVNLHSGEVVVTETDLEIRGRGFDFRFERRYRSGVTFDGPLGWNWEVDLGRRLVEMTAANSAAYAQQTGLTLMPGDVLRMDGTGRVDLFVRALDGSFTSPDGVYSRLSRSPDGSYVEIDRTGTKATYAVPNPAGVAHMTAVADRAGNTQRFEYNPQGRLVRVFDTLGRPIDFGYDVRGRLSFLQDFSGRRVTYAYDEAGHLIAVTSPPVVGTVHRNDFPTGKTTRYAYSSGNPNPTLNHNLTSVTAPNEVASGGPPRVSFTYDMQDRATVFQTGGVNAGGVQAGGTISYTYRTLSHAPIVLVNTPVLETAVVDANGNRHTYQFNSAGNTVRFLTESNRDIRPDDPAEFETRAEYSAEGELLRNTSPAGAVVEYEYANPESLQRGDMIGIVQHPDAARGANQAELRTTMTYEPIFGNVRTVTDPRGNDPTYIPQNGGAQSPTRYRTTYTYDYQEGDNAAAMAARTGLSETDVRALLAAAGIATNLGDVNGDGITDQAIGNVVRVEHPAVQLRADSMLGTRLGQNQPSFELFGYNERGQPVFHVDREGNLSRFTYHPENDPDGDGRERTAGISEGPFGYLSGVVADAGINPGPPPTPRPTVGPPRAVIYLPMTSKSGMSASTHRAPASRGPAATTAGPAPDQAGREPAAPPWRNAGHVSPFTNRTTSYYYDSVGNPIRMVNPRGVTTEIEVNSLNQVVQIKPASDVQGALDNPAEPYWIACLSEELPECMHGMRAFAYRSRFTYDANDNIVKVEVEDRDGTVPPIAGEWIETSMSYDILDSLVTVVREIEEGRTTRTSMRYDRNGNHVMKINPVAYERPPVRQTDNIESAVYDERDMPATITRGGATAAFTALPAHGDIPELAVLQEGPNTSTISVAYDADGNVATIRDAADNSGDGSPERTTYLYDGFGRQVSEINGLGTQTFVEYDPSGNAVHTYVFGPLGTGASPLGDGAASFSQPLTPSSFSQPLLSESRALHDERGRTFQSEDRLFAYEGLTTQRPPILVDGPDDQPGDGWVTTRFEHDRADRLVYRIEDDGAAWRTEYDGLSQPVLAEDPESNVTRHRYDAAGNLVRSARTESARPADVAAGRRADSATYTTWTVYDALDRPIRVTDDAGQTSRVRYDSRDNPVWTADAQHSTRSANLLVDPLMVFPSPGERAAATRINRPGNVTRTEYDGLGRPVRSVAELREGGQGGAPLDTANPANPDGLVVVTSAYDAHGREVSRTDDLGNATLYTYDNLDRVTRTTLADGSAYESVWDRDDNLVRHTDPNGSAARMTVDGLGRVTAVEIVPGAGVVGTLRQTRLYDGLGRTTAATDENSASSPGDDEQVRFVYDSLGRVLEEVQNNLAVSSRWSGDGRRLAVVYPNGRVIGRTFDRLNQINQVVEAADGTVLADYDLMGTQRVLRRTTANGVKLSYLMEIDDGLAVTGYDAVGRLVDANYWLGDTVILGFAYGYSRQDQTTYQLKEHAPADSELYPYDSLSRLTSYMRGTLNADRSGIAVRSPTGLQQRTWLLDGAGNWGQVASTVDGTPGTEQRSHSAANAVTEAGEQSLVYDANGNLTDDGNNLYAWDYANRLRSVTRKADGALVAAYGYDAVGRRAVKTVTNSGALDGITRFVRDGWREIEERDGSGQVTQQVVYGQWLDEPLLLDQDVDGDGDPTGAGDRRLFFQHDHQFSTAALTDRTGRIVEGYRYDPYGRATVYSAGPNGVVDFGGDDGLAADGASPLGNPFLYAGRRFDRESGLYYYRTRFMDPVLGRFVSQDTIGPWGDPANKGNAYAYAGGLAQRDVDPMGRAKTTKSSKSNSSEKVSSSVGGMGPQPLAAGDPIPGLDTYLDQSPPPQIQAAAGTRPPRRRHVATLLPDSVGAALDDWSIPRGIPSSLTAPCGPSAISIQEEGINTGPGGPSRTCLVQVRHEAMDIDGSIVVYYTSELRPCKNSAQ